MKKVYIPTEEELLVLQKSGINIYNYLLTKTIESIIMVDVIYEEEDMFEVAYECFSEYPQIIFSMANMYPERIKGSQTASNDIDLCIQLASSLKTQDKTIYGLDHTRSFSEDVLKNKAVISSIIMTLSQKLSLCPRYRFEYIGPNNALDEIFNCEIDTKNMSLDTLLALTFIDPIYFVKGNCLASNQELLELAKKAAIRYSKMYGVDACDLRYNTNNLLANERVKKLIRHLDSHRQYYNF